MSGSGEVMSGRVGSMSGSGGSTSGGNALRAGAGTSVSGTKVPKFELKSLTESLISCYIMGRAWRKKVAVAVPPSSSPVSHPEEKVPEPEAAVSRSLDIFTNVLVNSLVIVNILEQITNVVLFIPRCWMSSSRT